MTFEPLERESWGDPYPAYRDLRDQDSLHWAPKAGVFCASRFDEASAIFKQPELFSSGVAFDLLVSDRWKTVGWRDVFEMVRFFARSRVNPLLLRSAPETLLSSDPPRHDVLRATVNRGFTPRRIAAWEPRVRDLCRGYVSRLESVDQVDIVETIAHPLPMTVIAEMLGVEADRIADFRRWSSNVISGLTGSDRADSPAAMLGNAGELLGYLRAIVEERRRQPGDDLISTLVDPKHRGTLDTESVLSFATVLLIAGNETTTNAIANTVKLLIEHPHVLEAVQDDPTLIPALVEESLRYESPFQFMPRLAIADTELRDTRIPKNSTVLVMIGAANRDERRFANAELFDIHRESEGHLAFGHGIHFCIGASLARLEMRVALEVLVPKLTGWTIREGGAVLADSFLTRGPARLELTRTAKNRSDRPPFSRRPEETHTHERP